MVCGDAGAGILLILAAAAAIAVANSPAAPGYHAWLHDPLPWQPIAALPSLHAWINDAAMAVFFFVIGLEIKREALIGDLADPARRRLPFVAALAGMAVPAAIYFGVAGTAPPLARGWAIPAATDIAFALGVLALLGKRVPASLRLFLLTVAIVDDLGAVIIIAVFYTGTLDAAWLAAAVAAVAAMTAVNRAGSTRGWIYGVLAALAWYALLHSGVHATVAGVAAALTIPLQPNVRGDSLLLRVEHALAPWTAYLIVPVFGFANAGVALARPDATAPATLPLAIAAGLVIGKQVGVFGAVLLADRSGFAPRPASASWLQVWGTALLCGIGFTMSLFVTGLAFPAHPELVDQAKIGILGGSLVSAIAGFVVLRLARRAS